MSAADFWRVVYPANRVPQQSEDTLEDTCLACNEEDVWQLAPSWVTPRFLEPEGGVLHVLVESQEKRRLSSSHQTHVWSEELPVGFLYALGNEAYVSSPAFTFLQLAQTLDLVQLICYGCELCGIYAFDKFEKRGFRKRNKPLVNKDALRNIVMELGNIPGVNRARKALCYIVDNSASPRETLGALQLELPYRYGGYGIEGFVMNLEVPLEGPARYLYPKPSCKIDIYFPEKRLAV